VVQKTDRHEFSFPELYVKADRTVKSESRFGFDHIRTADLGKYGFSLQEIYPKKNQPGTRYLAAPTHGAKYVAYRI
jgi:hypothetical protein